MSWNYRLIKKTVTFEGEIYTVASMHEVYYDNEGNIEGWTANPIDLGNYDDLDDMKASMELMMKAFEKPALGLYTDSDKNEFLSELSPNGVYP